MFQIFAREEFTILWKEYNTLYVLMNFALCPLYWGVITFKTSAELRKDCAEKQRYWPYLLLCSSQTFPKTSQTTLAFQSRDPTSPNTTDTEQPLSTNPRLPHHPSPSLIIRVLIFFSVFMYSQFKSFEIWWKGSVYHIQKYDQHQKVTYPSIFSTLFWYFYIISCALSVMILNENTLKTSR